MRSFVLIVHFIFEDAVIPVERLASTTHGQPRVSTKIRSPASQTLQAKSAAASVTNSIKAWPSERPFDSLATTQCATLCRPTIDPRA